MSQEFFSPNSSLITRYSSLFVFFMQLMTTAATAEFFKLKPIRRVLFILRRRVVALFALSALQNNIISCHKSSTSQKMVT